MNLSYNFIRSAYNIIDGGKGGFYSVRARGEYMYCTRCGALIEAKDFLCRECGEQYKDLVLKKQSKIRKFIEVTDDESSKK